MIPRPQPGQTEAVAIPAAHLVPWMLGSATLAVTFAYAMVRRSTRALMAGYLVLLLIVGAAVARRF